jgi:ERG8-type phosphomevalonate kinase
MKTPGKMILMGEYAVLEGSPALVTAVDRFCYTDIHIHEKDHYIVTAPTIGVPEVQLHPHPENTTVVFEPSSEAFKDKLMLVKLTFEYFLAELDAQIPFCGIQINTDEFYNAENAKIGLGSSAAVVVSLVHGLSHISDDLNFSQQEIYTHALSIHRNAQDGRGSGIDIAASTFGGTLQYKLNQADHSQSRVLHCDPLQSLITLPIWTGTSASTSVLIQKLSRKKTSAPAEYSKMMSQLTSLSEEACRAYAENDPSLFIRTAEHYFNAMESLGEFINAPVISGEHLKIRDLVKSAGGAYKPSGAGLGDIGLAFTDNAETKSAVIQEIGQSKFDVLDLSGIDTGSSINTSIAHVTQDK